MRRKVENEDDDRVSAHAPVVAQRCAPKARESGVMYCLRRRTIAWSRASVKERLGTVRE